MRPLRDRTGRKIVLLMTAAVAGIALLGVGASYVLRRWEYAPSRPRQITRQFVELVERGDLKDAYALTNEGAMVGTTFEKFEANVRREFGVTAFPMHRPIREVFQNTTGLTYGSMLRLWIQGRKAGFDQIGYEVFFADKELPVSVSISLKVDGHGRWRIKYFESHAG